MCRGEVNSLSGTNIQDFWEFSNQKKENVAVFMEGTVTDPNWEFSWRCPLFVWQNEMLVELLEDLEDIRESQVEDVWWWRLEAGDLR